MATMFACLNRALEDLTVGLVNADIGAESCSKANLSSLREMIMAWQ